LTALAATVALVFVLALGVTLKPAIAAARVNRQLREE
jgi:hypothetical protein